MAEINTGLAAILRRHEARLLADWMTELAKAGRSAAIDKAELEEQARTFVRLLTEAAQTDALENVGGSAGGPLWEMLVTLSASHARQGFTPTETATFVFSFKRPLFAILREVHKQDAEGLARELWVATTLLDKLHRPARRRGDLCWRRQYRRLDHRESRLPTPRLPQRHRRSHRAQDH